MISFTTAKRLVSALRWSAQHQDGLIETKDWTHPHWTREEFTRWFSQCLADKINHSDPRFPRGRKAQDEYQIELSRLRHYIGNRIVIHWVAPCLGPRVKAALKERMGDHA